ncbi:DUF3515 domain-containing protein [Corynebacterium auriscanis]|uniref:DUF3515 domain-containing protein n=1 Tax=Corynebacterium TaxID=1716 RepID=UPI0008A63F95|nr:DUF3515 domain-containing protein [Corynebacterium sp. HMSC28B08]OFT86902.1 hypothetical protein HMPREF3098_10420 [Corynebacterium sp. HMSC28B08]
MSTQASTASPSGTSANNSTNPTSDNTTPRFFIFLALALGVIFVAGVLAGAKVLNDRNTYSPVTMGPVDAPQADSAQCRDLTGALPQRTAGFRIVDVHAPAPAGTAAYRNEQGTELTIRCGVNAPDQYTQASLTEQHAGTQWLPITDATPGSNLRTYYTVGAGPVIAVTSEADFSGALDDFGSVVSSYADAATAPARKPYPLSTQKPAATVNAKVCATFLDALPGKLGDYTRVGGDDPVASKAPEHSATFRADRREPIVVRCGLDMPKGYKAGERLSSVNDVPWFAEPGLAQGSTSGNWFGLGREEIVGISMPGAQQDNAVITEVSKAMTATMKKTEN